MLKYANNLQFLFFTLITKKSFRLLSHKSRVHVNCMRVNCPTTNSHKLRKNVDDAKMDFFYSREKVLITKNNNIVQKVQIEECQKQSSKLTVWFF